MYGDGTAIVEGVEHENFRSGFILSVFFSEYFFLNVCFKNQWSKS